MKSDKPVSYRYYELLKNHLGKNINKIFNGQFLYPRQLEIHLPGNHIKHCQFSCRHCQGIYYIKEVNPWETTALELIENLKGSIPFHIYGGAYSEPLMNPYLMSFLAFTKKYNNHFGIHTNGAWLCRLEEQQGFLTELNRLSTDDVDYLSVSLDAGLPSSWANVKNTNKKHLFNEIINALRKSVDIRNKSGRGHSIRVCYLITEHSGSEQDFENIISLLSEIGVDSIRFAIPYANYLQDFSAVRRYKKNVEIPNKKKYKKMLDCYLSKSRDEKPYIFFVDPEDTDIEKYNFRKCIYTYYQITLGADGNFYRCSAIASPSMKVASFGRITSDLDVFHDVLQRSQSKDWDCNICFRSGCRCNRMGVEINRAYFDQEFNQYD